MRKWMTVQEVSELFRTHPQTIRNWLNSGKIEGVKLGHRWRVATEYDPKSATTTLLFHETLPRN
jgi:excisionase family DNA binding protein